MRFNVLKFKEERKMPDFNSVYGFGIGILRVGELVTLLPRSRDRLSAYGLKLWRKVTSGEEIGTFFRK